MQTVHYAARSCCHVQRYISSLLDVGCVADGFVEHCNRAQSSGLLLLVDVGMV